MMTSNPPELQQIVDAIRAGASVSSSRRTRGPTAIRSDRSWRRRTRCASLGKVVTIVNADPAPAPLMQFPGVPAITIADHVDGDYDAAIIMECGDLARTGVSGLERSFVINIDHHPGQHAATGRSTGSTGGRGVRRDGVRPRSRRSASS